MTKLKALELLKANNMGIVNSEEITFAVPESFSKSCDKEHNNDESIVHDDNYQAHIKQLEKYAKAMSYSELDVFVSEYLFRYEIDRMKKEEK